VASISGKFVILAAAFAGGTPALAQATDEFGRRHKELLARDDLQFTFAEPETPQPAQPDMFPWLNDFLDAIAPVFTWLFWIALGLGVAALLWFIGREIYAAQYGRSRKPVDVASNQVTDFRPEPARARALLQEADRLAALGRFDEAARTLLHRSIDDIEARAPRSIRKAQTAREIAGLPVLPQAVRTAFAPITRAVEESWFGGRKLDSEGYKVCRKAYADFAMAESWT
jgi:hypothetical protein